MRIIKCRNDKHIGYDYEQNRRNDFQQNPRPGISDGKLRVY